MMTFNEAVDKITKETRVRLDEVLIEDGARVYEEKLREIFTSYGFVDEARSNEKLQQGLAHDAEMIWLSTVPIFIQEGPVKAVSLLADSLGRWFYLGLMVGIVMEKQEIKE